MNTFGNIFRLTTFGESHGPAIGGVIDGMPAGVDVDTAFIQSQLDRRRPGQSAISTSRREADKIELLSGVFEGKTTGCPIGFLIRNADHHSSDYDNLKDLFRPSHADYAYWCKYGIRDHRGGGRSSARETISRVAGGAFARLYLDQRTSVRVTAFTSQVGSIELPGAYNGYDLSLAETNAVRCPDPDTAAKMESLILQARKEGDTVGGVVTCVVTGCPPGLGEPVFGKLQARLAAAMMGINAAKGFEYGTGFAGACRRGSEENDIFVPAPGTPHGISTLTNRSGGIQGGISNGQDIYFRVAFKPIATLLREQPTVDKEGRPACVAARGRHDPCAVPRAVPIVEAMAAMVMADEMLLSEAYTSR